MFRSVTHNRRGHRTEHGGVPSEVQSAVLTELTTMTSSQSITMSRVLSRIFILGGRL